MSKVDGAMPPSTPDRPRIPFGGEFSPNQIELARVLAIASRNAGDRAGAVEDIRQAYFAESAPSYSDPAERRIQQWKRAGNVLIGMQGYGLYDAHTQALTTFGKELHGAASDAERFADFAREILLNRLGMTVLQAIRNIYARQEMPGKGTIAVELDRLGVSLPRATTHHLVLLSWLRQAGLVSEPGYDVDEDRVYEVAGLRVADVDAWTQLTNPQRAVLRVLHGLSAVHGTDPVPAQSVIELVEAEYGPIFGARDQLRSRVFNPLEQSGWVKMSARSGGRGAKSGSISATERLLELNLDSVPAAVASAIPATLIRKLNTPIGTIYDDLKSSDVNVKGIALELLALRIATDLNISPRRLRLSAAETSGGEVDLVAEAAHLHFSRWLFQCKNTHAVALSDLAREVGMAVLLHAHVIVLVTTGAFRRTVVQAAKDVAESTPLQVVLLDGHDVESYRRQGASYLLDFFHAAAGRTLELKRPQIEKDVGPAV